MSGLIRGQVRRLLPRLPFTGPHLTIWAPRRAVRGVRRPLPPFWGLPQPCGARSLLTWFGFQEQRRPLGGCQTRDRARFGLGPGVLALWTGCLTRGEDQCLHRRLLFLSHAEFTWAAGKGSASPGSAGFPIDPRDQCLRAQGLALRKGCDTPDRGGRKSIEPARRTTRESQTKRWRDKRSASD